MMKAGTVEAMRRVWDGMPGFEVRHSPLRPLCLGTHRRKRASVLSVPKVGASRAEGPTSLDTKKQLETSDSSLGKWQGRERGKNGKVREMTVAEWRRANQTEEESYRLQWHLHKTLTQTAFRIWQKWARAGEDDESRAWKERYSAALATRDGEEPIDRHRRIDKWLKENKATGSNAQALRWEKKWAALNNCQMEWIGYKASCCEHQTPAVAVPIGCGDRLCPLCAWHRSRRARLRIKRMFDRLTHPVLLTLTIPNLAAGKLRKHSFTLFRQRVRQFIKQHPDVLGGVYSIETTFNRKESAWHIHAHILADFARALPTKGENKIPFAARDVKHPEPHERVRPFIALKWGLEFDWLALWADGKQLPKMPTTKKPKKGAKKWASRWDDYEWTFRQWVQKKREHSTKWAKVFNGFKWVLRDDLTAAEFAAVKRSEAWNRKWTRVIDIRPVTDREGAAAEVLKYITKGADFIDRDEAVEEFSNAVRGARLVQTFGSWYGFNVDDTEFDPKNLDDWGEMPKCACGVNHWERCGVFFRSDVHMQEDGRWFLNRSFTGVARGSPGTVVKPMIRALSGDHQPKDEREGFHYAV